MEISKETIDYSKELEVYTKCFQKIRFCINTINDTIFNEGRLKDSYTLKSVKQELYTLEDEVLTLIGKFYAASLEKKND